MSNGQCGNGEKPLATVTEQRLAFVSREVMVLREILQICCSLLFPPSTLLVLVFSGFVFFGSASHLHFLSAVIDISGFGFLFPAS